MYMNNSLALPAEYSSKIIPFKLVEGRKAEKKIKYNLDGSVKKTGCNKVSGKSSEVYAFRSKEEISAMVDAFDRRIEIASGETRKKIAHRNKLLFLIGINVGIRGSDLVSLKWSFFFDRQSDGSLVFKKFYVLQPKKQKKYGKFVKLYFNHAVQNAVNSYIAKYPVENLNDFLFPSQKGIEPVEVGTIWEIIKQTACEAGIEQNIGSHSLRKTFGFWCWHNSEDKDKALVILQHIFGHSSTQTTAKYIGIMDDEIEDMFNSIELGTESF